MTRKKQARILRIFRKIHRTAGALLFVFFFVVSITGLILGWKKNASGFILPETEVGISTDVTNWIPLEALQKTAFKALQDSVDTSIDLTLNRIDARPDKGVVKFIFDNHYWGVQVDGQTGEVLAVTRRRSDLVENIHDGAVLDEIFKTDGEILKLLYTTITGLGLFIFTSTGFWLWYGPKHMRRTQRRGALAET